MAKKRKKKRPIGTQLKYEVYGILLITISIIALSGEATVGRALSKFLGLFLGKFYFVIAIVGILVGLTVMVKRTWPKGWSVRKTGMLLAILALTLSSSISEINARYVGVGHEVLSGKLILGALDYELRSQLLTSDTSDIANKVSIRDMSISGGYVGALQYSFLFMLFGYYGALIVNIVMYLISLLLITGKSYVEMIRFVKLKIGRAVKLLASKMSVSMARKKAKTKTAAAVVQLDDEDNEDDFAATDQKAPKKKSAFFSWYRAEEKEKEVDHDLDEWEVTHSPIFEQNQETVEEQHDQSLYPQSEHEDENFEHLYSSPQPKELEQHESISHLHNEELFEYQNELDEKKLEDTTLMDTSDVVDATTDENDEEYNYPKGEAVTSEALISENELVEDSQDSVVKTIVEKPYTLPPFTLLNKPSNMVKSNDISDMYDSRRKLEATLESFGVRAKVLDVVRGPAVTRYEVQPATGVKVSKIVGLTDDIALALAAKDVRMEAPIPGKSAIGIEVPNGDVAVVTMREVMETPIFMNSASRLSIAFGRDISGQTIVGNLAKMPHLLVAGATGSGKSVCINGIIASILYKAKPDEVKFLMIDPKMVELNVYNGIPHLLAPVVTNPKRASMALKKIVVEMERRYELFSKSGTRNIEGYNQHVQQDPATVLPYIVVIVDELADLMMVASNDVEDSIARLAQMARAAGIHLIIATQRPSVDVITGVIKANIPSRIAFGVSSQVDSRTILDMAGAEKLLGRGDMLFLPMGMSKPIRVQGAFLSDDEVESLVSFVSQQGEVKYNEELVPEIEDESDEAEMIIDDLFEEAAQIIIDAKQASVSLLQRRLRIGYTRAARMIDQLEAKGIVGPYEGSKPREVLITEEQWNAMKQSS